MLQLTKPLCVFDLETTGININQDRIVEISILKVFPNGNKESKTYLVNPGIPIPKESSDIHGITDEKVQNEPTFKELAPKILELIKGSDLAGFNSNRFDIPLLAEELLRNGFDFDLTKHKAVDVQVIFHKMEQRTLSAAYKFYCNKDLIDAHSASADTLATYEVLEAQIEKYPDLTPTIGFLSEFSSQNKNLDPAGMIGQNAKNEAIFNFGKYKGKPVCDVFAQDLGYYSWIQKSDFPLYTKKVLTQIKLQNAL
ncbi:MAG: DNA polymerase III subunit epsilon [Flavobacteriaceae bacterium]|nr:MAG: DNA polymerase III subunit epsilon [Flavobacteriaceae bacterium]